MPIDENSLKDALTTIRDELQAIGRKLGKIDEIDGHIVGLQVAFGTFVDDFRNEQGKQNERIENLEKSHRDHEARLRKLESRPTQ